MANSRHIHKKLCDLNSNSESGDKYKNHFENTLQNSVPQKFLNLTIIGSFLKLLTILQSISIQATSYADKYNNLNGESFNNKTLNK